MHRGGDGIVRELEFLTAVEASLLSDRRVTAPYGLYGGRNGSRGQNAVVREQFREVLGGKCSFDLKAGDVVRIETPGGGGWGSERSNKTVRVTERKRSR